MPLRSYDPALARWNRIDPVTHHSLSPYNSFDNNPVFYADPSGGNSWGSGDVVIDWNYGDDNGGFTWHNNSYNNGAGYTYDFDHDWAMQIFEPMDWESMGSNMALEAVGLTYRTYGESFNNGSFTRATVNSALRQITNNIQNGYVQEGYRQGQWAFASGIAENSWVRNTPVLGSFINSYDWFAEGDIGRGALYLAMGISDLAAAKAVGTLGIAAGRYLAKEGVKNSITNVTANILSRAEMSAIMGAGTEGTITGVTSVVKQDATLLKYAKQTFIGNNSLRVEANNLIGQLKNGNLNPGIGSKNIGKNIFEARSRGGARVYFTNSQNNITILGYSNKSNQQAVINRILKLY